MKLTLEDCEIREVVTLAGTGECAKCAMKQSADCRNVVICHLDGKDVAFWLTENPKSKAFHKTICHTSAPILVTGKHEPKDAQGREIFTAETIELIRPASSLTVTVVASPPEAGKIETLRGAAWCEKCRHSRGQDCQVVVRTISGGKNFDYWLTDDDTSKALHSKLSSRYVPVEVSGKVITAAHEGDGGIFTVETFQLNP